MQNKPINRIAIFASGSGTNAQNIFDFFSKESNVIVDSLLCNKKEAFVLERAAKSGVPAFLINRDLFYHSDYYISLLQDRNINLIVLAGFLWLIPLNLIRSFRIINIHPALLPKYGGKGMYGMKVHQAVIDNGEIESGITIHDVNEIYDNGKILFQAKCPVFAIDSADELASRIHQLEYKYFPAVIKKVVDGEL